jgi:RNA polymerase sigma-70 factor (ECF subfamily)
MMASGSRQRRLMIDRARCQRIDWEMEPYVAEPVSTSPTVEHLAEAWMELTRVERALRHLAPGQREVILLSRVTGMDALEIASITDSTPGTVRVTLHRALRRLRSLLEPSA